MKLQRKSEKCLKMQLPILAGASAGANDSEMSCGCFSNQVVNSGRNLMELLNIGYDFLKFQVLQC